MTAPSGRQIEIVYEGQRAFVVEVGGGLRRYMKDGSDILDGYAEDAMCSGGRGQVLLPWPNRLQDGAYDFDGRHLELPIDEITNSNAIHGLVRWRIWEAAAQSESSVTMRHVLPAMPGYPFSLDISIEYRLDHGGLSVTTTATNIGGSRCPFGAGAHPYLKHPGLTVDEMTLQSSARSHLLADTRGIPFAKATTAGSEYDFSQPRRIEATRLDDAFCDLERDADGLARTSLRDPSGSTVKLWQDDSYPYLMLFTGDTLADSRRSALAVEPMSCAPNAFRSGDGLVILDPGQSFRGRWGISLA